MRSIKVLLLIVALISACESEHTTIVKGKVINFGSKAPIEGVKVFLSDGIGLSGDFNLDFSTSSGKISTTITNSLGEFEIKITGEYEAFLSMSKDGYEFDPDDLEGLSVGVLSFREGRHENVVLHMKAKAFFYPTFVNAQNIICDTLKVYTDRVDPNHFARTPDVIFAGNGPYPYDTYKSDFFVGDTYTYYKLEFKRSGKWSEVRDSVFIRSFETLSNTIPF